MGDVMLHGVLNMPPELWSNTNIDKLQRYNVYMAASRRIEDLDRKLDMAIDLLDIEERAQLLIKLAK